MPMRRKGAIETAVRLSVKMSQLRGEDKATAELACVYAREIDSASLDVSKGGPLLLACLEALLMSPRARALALKGVTQNDNKPVNRLDELRERRARKSDSSAVDTATS